MGEAGYSQTPLAKKLGLKPGYKIKLINAPAHYRQLFADEWAFPDSDTGGDEKKNFIHFFTVHLAELQTVLPTCKSELLPDGMIWVSWPKKTAKTQTDVDENKIREAALAIGLVDVKVCAVDETWSALKLVIPVKDRGEHKV